jgi:hypothetical protein
VLPIHSMIPNRRSRIMYLENLIAYMKPLVEVVVSEAASL